MRSHNGRSSYLPVLCLYIFLLPPLSLVLLAKIFPSSVAALGLELDGATLLATQISGIFVLSLAWDWGYQTGKTAREKPTATA
jgi:hypothetical protein